MKEQLAIEDLVKEVRRQAVAKQDYLAHSVDLRYVLVFEDVSSEIEHVVNDAVSRSRARRATRTAAQIAEDTEIGGIKPALEWGVVSQDGRTEQALMPLNPTAHDQLAQHLGIPTRFYWKLLDTEPDLLATNVNTLLQKQPDNEQRMLRTLDGRIRAFLSASYQPLDNLTFINAMLPLLNPKDTGVQVDWNSAGISDDKLHVKFTVPTIQEEVRVGTVVRLGGYLGNSEVGLGYREFFPFTEVLSCTNGAYYTRWGQGVRTKHLGGRQSGNVRISDITERFRREQEDLRRLGQAVRNTITPAGLKLLTVPMKKAMGVEVQYPAGAVQVLARKGSLTIDEQAAVLDYFLRERTGGPASAADRSIWALSQAVTRFSQDVPDYDHATELERLGGDIITLDPSEWRVLANTKPEVKRR